MPLPCEPYPYVGAWRLSSVPVLRGSVPRLRGLGTSIGLVQGRVYPTVAERAAANAAPMRWLPSAACRGSRGVYRRTTAPAPARFSFRLVKGSDAAL